jgi:hypothetical protein
MWVVAHGYAVDAPRFCGWTLSERDHSGRVILARARQRHGRANHAAGVWWNKDEPGSGFGLDYKDGTLLVEVYSYVAGGASQWYLGAGPLTNNVFTATLDKYVNGQCVSCAYKAPGVSGNDGTLTITFTSSITANVDLPGGRHIQIERFFP